MKKIYLAALIFAILTGVAIYAYTNQLAKAPQANMVSVVVAKQRIPERTLITSELLEVVQMPSSAVHPLAIKTIAGVSGKVAAMTIEAKEQVLQSKLTERDIKSSGLSYNVPAGKRAHTVEVSDTSGVAGYIKAGDHVDIVAVLLFDQTTNGLVTKVPKSVILLQNIEVLVLGKATVTGEESAENAKNYTVITLAVTQEEALKLFYAQTNGKLTVVLRPGLDGNLGNVTPYTPQ